MTLSNDVRRVYIDRPTDHIISLEYLIYFTVLHCALAKFCQILLNEYCTVLYCTRTDPLTQFWIEGSGTLKAAASDINGRRAHCCRCIVVDIIHNFTCGRSSCYTLYR